MKTILFLTMMLSALLLSGCSSAEIKEKDLEIIRLKIALASQHGARAAEIEYADQQASFYLGCKAFFDRCSPETIERGQKLLKNGFTGTTSGWYWAGLLGELACIAVAVAVFMTLFMHLYLKFIAPRVGEVEQAQQLVDGVDEYVAEGNRWRATHEQKMLTENRKLAKLVSETKTIKRERDRLYQSALDARAGLASVQSQSKEAEERKASTQSSGDF